MYERVWCWSSDSGTQKCDFNEIDICGYRDESVGEIGWTRFHSSGKFTDFNDSI